MEDFWEVGGRLGQGIFGDGRFAGGRVKRVGFWVEEMVEMVGLRGWGLGA